MPSLTRFRAIAVAFVLAALSARGQSFGVLWTFSNTISPGDVVANAGVVVAGNILYGVQTGNANGSDAAFYELNLNGGGLTNAGVFPEGAVPYTTLAADGGLFFGVDEYGGTAGDGSVFEISSNGSGFSQIYSFGGITNGSQPYGGVVAAGMMLYGTTLYGSAGQEGTVFAVATNGGGFTNLHTFGSIADNAQGIPTNTDGFDPEGTLALDSGAGVLYGTTFEGGGGGGGTVFKLNTNGSGFTVLHTFAYSDGFNPAAALTVSNGVIYGTTEEGGTAGNGTVFQLGTNGQNFSVLHNFSALVSSRFTNSDGAAPRGSLVLVSNVLYGTAEEGGMADAGTIFAITTNGSFTPLYEFSGGKDGGAPSGALAFANNTLYGVTSVGGAGDGTVFEVTFNVQPCPISIQSVGPNVVLTWTNSAFVLQGSGEVGGPYTNVGQASPCSLPATNGQMFFRLEAP